MNDSDFNSKLSVVIVAWNSAGEIRECLASLASVSADLEIVVVDNASSDETVGIVRAAFPRVRIIEIGDNSGFAAACNVGAKDTNSDLVLFLNPDTIANRDALESAVFEIESDRTIGLISVAIDDELGDRQRICYRFPTLGNALLDGLGLYRFVSESRRPGLLLGDFFDNLSSRDVDWVYGAFMLVRRSALESVAGVPEDFFLFGEDTDLCYQLKRKGFRIRFSADVSIVHKSNRSAGQLPSGWRIERTTLTKYAFAFKNFGGLRTRSIQIVDLAANIISTADQSFRSRSESRLDELRRYRKVIVRSLLMSRERLLLTIRRPPIDSDSDPI
jgi:GT2 family glycosyltransferase